MYNQYAEAKTLYVLPTVLKYAEELNLTAKVLPNAFLNLFRDNQKDLSSKGIRFTPSQLTLLARYLYFGTAGQDMNQTREKLKQWIGETEEGIRKLFGRQYESGAAIVLNENYDLPCFDRSASMEVILQNAVMAGKLNKPEKYPDPCGLVLCDPVTGENKGYVKESCSTEETIRFWKAQMDALKTHLETTANAALNQASKIRMALTIFTMMLWYAERFAAYRKESVLLGETFKAPEGEIVLFPVNRTYLQKCVFVSCSSNSDFTGLLSAFKTFLVFKKISDRENAIGFRFAELPNPPENPPEESKSSRLPDLNMLDHGGRLFPANDAFFGLDAKYFKAMLKGMTDYRLLCEAHSENEYAIQFVRKDRKEVNPDELRKAVRETLIRYAKSDPYIMGKEESGKEKMKAERGKKEMIVQRQAAWIARAYTLTQLLIEAGCCKEKKIMNLASLQSFFGREDLIDSLMEKDEKFAKEIIGLKEKKA